MARPKKDKPSYCRDKSSNRAFVTLAGKRKYLGDWNTRESRDEYDRFIGEWMAAGRQRVELQTITGMRAGEMCVMRGCDITTTDRTWQY